MSGVKHNQNGMETCQDSGKLRWSWTLDPASSKEWQ